MTTEEQMPDALFRWEQYAFHKERIGDIKFDELRRCLNDIRAASAVQEADLDAAYNAACSLSKDKNVAVKFYHAGLDYTVYPATQEVCICGWI